MNRSRARRGAVRRSPAPLLVCARLLVLPGAPDASTLAGELGLAERVTPQSLVAVEPAAPDSASAADAALATARAALAELRDADADAALTLAEAHCRTLLRVRGDAGPLFEVHLERAALALRRGERTELDARLHAATLLAPDAVPDPVRYPPALLERLRVVRTAAATAAPASLTLRSEPAGAAIWLDGRPLPRQTPATLDGLPAGTHHLRVQLAGWRPWYTRVELEAAGHQRLDVYLEPARDAAAIARLTERAVEEQRLGRVPAPAVMALAELAQAEAVFGPGGVLYGADGRPLVFTIADENSQERTPPERGLVARYWWVAPVALAVAGGAAAAIALSDDGGGTIIDLGLPCATLGWSGACGGRAPPPAAQALAAGRQPVFHAPAATSTAGRAAAASSAAPATR